jgi:hypothetical protein
MLWFLLFLFQLELSQPLRFLILLYANVDFIPCFFKTFVNSLDSEESIPGIIHIFHYRPELQVKSRPVIQFNYTTTNNDKLRALLLILTLR